MIFLKKIVSTIIILNSLILLTNAWHSSIEFDFKINDYLTLKPNGSLNGDDKLQARVFESVYLNRDYFALLSSNRNNFFDIENSTILIGAR